MDGRTPVVSLSGCERSRLSQETVDPRRRIGTRACAGASYCDRLARRRERRCERDIFDPTARAGDWQTHSRTFYAGGETPGPARLTMDALASIADPIPA